jgi:hypothetical protein
MARPAGGPSTERGRRPEARQQDVAEATRRERPIRLRKSLSQSRWKFVLAKFADFN